MSKTFLINLFVVLLVLSYFGCNNDKSNPSSGLEFAIHEGEQHPACTRVITLIDSTLPQTVDTVNWGNPIKVNSSVNDNCPNDDPEISPDGNTLYFYWSPGMNLSHEELLRGTTGVYFAQRNGGPGDFGSPRFLDLRKGTLHGAVDGHPKISATGDRIYFHSTRAENTGYQQTPVVNDILDIYTASLTGNSAGPAVNLGKMINSVYADGEQGISPDGITLYFESKRPGGIGKGDIYYSKLSGTTWSAPINMAELNTIDNEGQIAFAANNPNVMYFTSDRNSIGSAIYRSAFNGVSWGAPELIVQGQVGSASLTADGKIMYFVHVLTDNAADPVFDADIYYIEHK